MLVEIFKSDIKHGDQGNCQQCVVARAINRVLPEGHVASVVGPYYDIRETRKNEYGTFTVTVLRDVPLPREVKRYVSRFDKNKKSVLPTVFNITVPELPVV